jgi:hypothetical protein
MMRTWKLLGLSTLTALLLVLRASAGGQPTDGVIPQNAPLTKEHLDALEKRFLAEFKKISDAFRVAKERLDDLEANDKDTRLKLSGAQIRIEQLKKQADQLRLDMEELQKRLPRGNISKYPPSDKADLDEIRAQLAQIQQTLARMQSPSPRTVFTNPPTATGTIVLVNRHPETLLFVINQKAYRAVPGQTVTINNMPAGSFTYEVISPTSGSGGAHTRVLAAGETYTLTARP